MRYAAFLRAINIGGRRVSMEQLRTLLSASGFENVKTLIASGNVILDHPSTSGEFVESLIESSLKEGLGYDVPTFVRTLDELETLPVYEAEWTAVNVMFFRSAVDPKQVATLRGLETENDSFEVVGRHSIWLCKTRMSESLLFTKPLDKMIGSHTARSQTTVQRIIAALSKAD